MSKDKVMKMENDIYDDVFMQENNSLIYERLFSSIQKEKSKQVEQEREKKWNSRFHLDPMPSYNVMRDRHAKMYTNSGVFKGGTELSHAKKLTFDTYSNYSAPSYQKDQRSVKSVSGTFSII